MTNLARQLAALIDKPSGMTQTFLSEASGISQGQISRYISGEDSPEKENLEKICKALCESDRADVVLAYLQDQIPESARHLIAPARLKHFQKAKRVEVPLPRDLREAFDVLEERASRSPAVADSIKSTVRILEGAPRYEKQPETKKRKRR